jgi:L-idonate 5-dehydrogenase
MMDVFLVDNGYFDVAFECSAAQAALQSCIETVRPQGTIIQIGVTGNLSIPINKLVGKEIFLLGAHRFQSEFETAVELIDRGIIDVTPIISRTYSMEQALEAFEFARDRAQAVKVQLSFKSKYLFL